MLIKSYLRNVILSFFLAAGYDHYLSKSRKGHLIILCYHGIRALDSKLIPPFSQRSPREDIFEGQIRWLVKGGYKFLTLSEVLLRWKKRQDLPDRVVCLTFDDGYKNVIQHAYPIMLKYGARGCIYVVSGLPDSNNLLWTDIVELAFWAKKGGVLQLDSTYTFSLKTETRVLQSIKDATRYLRRLTDRTRKTHMQTLQQILHESHFSPPWIEELRLASWQDLTSLDPRVLEVGSHTKNHPNLDRVRENDLNDEILYSKKDIETYLNRRVDHFCYPGGAFNDLVKEFVRKSGYFTAVSTRQGVNGQSQDKLALYRYTTYSDTLLMRAKISGVYEAVFGNR